MVADKGKGTPADKKVSEAARLKPTGNAPISKGADGAVEKKLAADNLARGVPEPAKTERNTPVADNKTGATPKAEQKAGDTTKAANPDDATAFQSSIMEYMTQRMAVLQTGKVASPEELIKEKMQEISWIKDALRPEAEGQGSPDRQKKRRERHQALLDSLKKDVDEIKRQIEMSKDMGKTPR